MCDAINDGRVVALEPRSAKNTTPTSFETFVKDVFVPAYRGQAGTASSFYDREDLTRRRTIGRSADALECATWTG